MTCALVIEPGSGSACKLTHDKKSVLAATSIPDGHLLGCCPGRPLSRVYAPASPAVHLIGQQHIAKGPSSLLHRDGRAIAGPADIAVHSLELNMLHLHVQAQSCTSGLRQVSLSQSCRQQLHKVHVLHLMRSTMRASAGKKLMSAVGQSMLLAQTVPGSLSGATDASTL